MAKLRGLLLGAKFKKLTHIKPKTRNVTRWSSVSEMIIRYLSWREVLPELQSSEIDASALTVSKEKRIDRLIKQLTLLESVTKKLQEKETAVSDSRALFCYRWEVER